MRRCRPVAILLATVLMFGTAWTPDLARASRMPQEMPGPIEVSDPDMPTPIEQLRGVSALAHVVVTLGRVHVLLAHAYTRVSQITPAPPRSRRPTR
jgi:hypothetical protein